MEPIVYFDGRMVEASSARIGALSPAIMRGPVVYETVRGHWNAEREQLYLFRVAEHLSRLRDSLRILRFADLPDPAELTRAFTELPRRNGLREDVSFWLFAYPAETSTGRWAPDRTTVAISARARPSRQRQPARCRVSAWRAGSDDSNAPRVKSMAVRLFNRAAMAEAEADGYDQLILLDNRGKVAEGAVTNVFTVRDGRVATPPVTGGILDGVTRRTVLDLLRRDGIDATERDLDLTELLTADEVFLTGTGPGIWPVGSLDGMDYGEPPGPVTRHVTETYLRAAREPESGANGWLTPVWPSADPETAAGEAAE